MTADLTKINARVQTELRKRGLRFVEAVEAARWLDNAGLLPDSRDRPGRGLRELLRAKLIAGARQEPPQKHGRWFIDRQGA